MLDSKFESMTFVAPAKNRSGLRRNRVCVESEANMIDTSERRRSALTSTKAERATVGDIVTGVSRTIGNIAEMLLLILIVEAQPIWVVLLTLFVFS
jgi:hypothetical protein